MGELIPSKTFSDEIFAKKVEKNLLKQLIYRLTNGIVL